MSDLSVTTVVPPATVGMLGGGQLGRYALMAATAMGYRTIVLDPDPNAPAGVVAGEQLVAAYDDDDALTELETRCDVVTTEFENPPATALGRLARTLPVFPRAASVAVAQDRIAEKRFLVDHGFPVGPHVPIATGDSVADDAVAPLLGSGAIVKSARLGYDGKGQRHVGSPAEVRAAIEALGSVDVVVEARLDLATEVSVLVARTEDGRLATWPVAENEHVDGILDVSTVPAPVSAELAERAVALATDVAHALDYVGVLAVEMFVVGRGVEPDLVVNELAPRPHNSGHWTIDVAVTSQFQQQIRAICGLGLGSTELTAPAASMVNLLGDLWFDARGERREPRWDRALQHPGASLHLYGKREPRPGRKMGHLTVTAATASEARRTALDLRAALTG